MPSEQDLQFFAEEIAPLRILLGSSGIGKTLTGSRPIAPQILALQGVGPPAWSTVRGMVPGVTARDARVHGEKPSYKGRLRASRRVPAPILLFPPTCRCCRSRNSRQQKIITMSTALVPRPGGWAILLSLFLFLDLATCQTGTYKLASTPLWFQGFFVVNPTSVSTISCQTIASWYTSSTFGGCCATTTSCQMYTACRNGVLTQANGVVSTW